MNVVDFYKKLSLILEQYRDLSITYSSALFQLNELLNEAEKNSLRVNISENILRDNMISKYDEEISYEEVSYEESYDDEENEEDQSY